MAHKGTYGGKKNTNMGVPSSGTVKSGKVTASAYGPQKQIGSMSLAPKGKTSQAMQTSSSRRKQSPGQRG